MSEKLHLPKSAVKRIMKLNEDVKVISGEAVVSVSKATELFVGLLASEAHKAATENNRKTIKFEDIIVVSKRNTKQLEFMNEAFECSGLKSAD